MSGATWNGIDHSLATPRRTATSTVTTQGHATERHWAGEGDVVIKKDGIFTVVRQIQFPTFLYTRVLVNSKVCKLNILKIQNNRKTLGRN